MEVLSSRILLQPSDFAAARRWYCDVLGLRTYREYGVDGELTGVVLFLGGGFLELTSARPVSVAATPAPVTLWLQVPDLDAEHERLAATGEVDIVGDPALMAWGLKEMWISGPDGTRLVIVEVPEGHPIRTRLTGERGHGDG